MVVRYGRIVEKGFLPVFSVDSEEEAKKLLVLACETNLNGEFIARELAYHQTIENLKLFSKRLETTWLRIKKIKDKTT